MLASSRDSKEALDETALVLPQGSNYDDPGMQQTRLAAITFTDIVGYSRLMEENEQRTIEILQTHNDIVLPAISEGKGEVVDAIGDGLLVTYGSAFDALRSALRIHTAVAEHNEIAEPELRFQLRIGINIGDIWYENERIFGNGVNVAARVQPYAPPGGICITEDVYNQVKNKIDVPVHAIGSPPLKNISRSVSLYRVETGLELPENGSTTSKAKEPDPARSREESQSLDAIKERLLAEKEKISRSREELGDERSDPGRDLGTRIETGVYHLVEGIMDRAIEKWESMPEEQGERAKAKHAARPASESGEVDIILSTDKKGSNDDESKGGDGGGDLSLGLFMTAGFGVGFFYFGVAWMIWPLLIVGVLPTASGLFKLLRRRIRTQRQMRERPRELEREVLRLAKQFNGRVTVVQVASHTHAPLDEIQQTLDSMTARGYVSQNVMDNGVIEYEFPSIHE